MRLLAAIGALGIVIAIAAAGYFFGGFYNVSALNEDNPVVARAIARVRDASIARHAPAQTAVSVDDPAIIQAGAKAFAARGCVNCHGAPGADWAKFAEGLRPEAADLNEVAKNDSVGHIFWVVKNGINMTGMPSFEKAGASDDEIWKIAAFVKKLPAVKPEDYKAWSTSGNP